MNSTENEATILCRYLLGAKPNDATVRRYAKIVRSRLSAQEQDETLNFALKHTWSTGMLDGALAVVSPHAQLRQRLSILFAVLEATPEYSDYFLSRKRTVFYLFVLMIVGLRAITRIACGLLLLKVTRLRF